MDDTAVKFGSEIRNSLSINKSNVVKFFQLMKIKGIMKNNIEIFIMADDLKEKHLK